MATHAPGTLPGPKADDDINARWAALDPKLAHCIDNANIDFFATAGVWLATVNKPGDRLDTSEEGSGADDTQLREMTVVCGQEVTPLSDWTPKSREGIAAAAQVEETPSYPDAESAEDRVEDPGEDVEADDGDFDWDVVDDDDEVESDVGDEDALPYAPYWNDWTLWDLSDLRHGSNPPRWQYRLPNIRAQNLELSDGENLLVVTDFEVRRPEPKEGDVTIVTARAHLFQLRPSVDVGTNLRPVPHPEAAVSVIEHSVRWDPNADGYSGMGVLDAFFRIRVGASIGPEGSLLMTLGGHFHNGSPSFACVTMWDWRSGHKTMDLSGLEQPYFDGVQMDILDKHSLLFLGFTRHMGTLNDYEALQTRKEAPPFYVALSLVSSEGPERQGVPWLRFSDQSIHEVGGLILFEDVDAHDETMAFSSRPKVTLNDKLFEFTALHGALDSTWVKQTVMPRTALLDLLRPRRGERAGIPVRLPEGNAVVQKWIKPGNILDFSLNGSSSVVIVEEESTVSQVVYLTTLGVQTPPTLPSGPLAPPPTESEIGISPPWTWSLEAGGATLGESSSPATSSQVGRSLVLQCERHTGPLPSISATASSSHLFFTTESNEEHSLVILSF